MLGSMKDVGELKQSSRNMQEDGGASVPAVSGTTAALFAEILANHDYDLLTDDVRGGDVGNKTQDVDKKSTPPLWNAARASTKDAEQEKGPYYLCTTSPQPSLHKSSLESQRSLQRAEFSFVDGRPTVFDALFTEAVRQDTQNPLSKGKTT